jgi:hypothetical protein
MAFTPRTATHTFALCAPLLLVAMGGQTLRAQCLRNHYISDGQPASQLDCQPLATLTDIPPAQMTPDAQALMTGRHNDLARAARFHGFDVDAPGWSYTQSISPIVQKHLILAFVHDGPVRDRSRFVAIIPQDGNELVQVVPAYAHGLHPFRSDWQDKGTYAVFNRLLKSERGMEPLTSNSEWVNYAALYIAVAGGVPAIPTESDSVLANWKLAVRRATTPVILVAKNGKATIAFSEISDQSRSVSWKLDFNKQGQVEKASRSELRPQTVVNQQMARDHDFEPLPTPSSLNR